jgi:hypothetical protein
MPDLYESTGAIWHFLLTLLRRVVSRTRSPIPGRTAASANFSVVAT